MPAQRLVVAIETECLQAVDRHLNDPNKQQRLAPAKFTSHQQENRINGVKLNFNRDAPKRTVYSEISVITKIVNRQKMEGQLPVPGGRMDGLCRRPHKKEDTDSEQISGVDAKKSPVDKSKPSSFP